MFELGARGIWFAAGLVFVAVGLVGVIVPLLPTTIFLIAAAACFARSSPRLENRILAHPRFGPPVRAWRDEGAISRHGKLAAAFGIVLGFSIFLITVEAGTWVRVAVGLSLLAVIGFLVSRPTPSQSSTS